MYALLEQTPDGAARMQFASAGHPPPLLVTADGATRYLETDDHVPLGVGLDLPRGSTGVQLPAGSTLLLYSDGLVGHRARSITDGLDRLAQVAATLAASPVEHLCDALLEQNPATTSAFSPCGSNSTPGRGCWPGCWACRPPRSGR